MILSSSFHSYLYLLFFFFFNDTATTEIYTLSLHDALPILVGLGSLWGASAAAAADAYRVDPAHATVRSEEHTSELQSLTNLVCRLLLEKKKKNRRLVGCHYQVKEMNIGLPSAKECRRS